MSWGPFILFLLSGGRAGSPPPVAETLYLRLKVAGDEVGVRALEVLEERGKVIKMMNFDGENLEALWRWDDPGGLEALERIPGVELLEARKAQPSD